MTEEEADGKYLPIRMYEVNSSTPEHEIGINFNGGASGRITISPTLAQLNFGENKEIKLNSNGINIKSDSGVFLNDSSITGIKAPTADDMPANKAYVDSHVPFAMVYSEDGLPEKPSTKITQDNEDITNKVKRTLSPSYTATISTTWVEDSNTGAQSQSVAIDGIKASDIVIVDHVYNGDSYDTFVEAENQYLNYITNGYAETYDGGITFYIFGDANTVDIPIIVEVA